MIQIMYQNNETGVSHDITTLITGAIWKTVRTGAPGSIELSMLEDSEIAINHGGIIVIKTDNIGVFHGYVFKYSRSDQDTIRVTAYDQLRYLKNKDTYVFKGKRADQIVSQIASDFEIKTGLLANTGYVIPSMIKDSSELFDIILDSLDQTLMNKNEMFYLWDDFGSLRISNVKDDHISLIVGDDSLVTSYEYTSDIESDTANKVKLVRDNKETGKRDVYIVQNSDNMKRWGVLQHYDKVNENLNKAQIEAQAHNLLKLKNRPFVSLDMEAIAELSVRAGRSLFIKLPKIKVSGWYIIDECTHDLLKETMKLKMVVV